jgi:recombination protein RecT
MRTEGKPTTAPTGAITTTTPANLSAANPPRDIQTFGLLLERNRGRLALAARGYRPDEELIILAKKAASRTPKLLECTGESILRALMDAMQLRIKPNHAMGRGYLIPRRRKLPDGRYVQECEFDPGFRGLLDIVRRSGKMTITCHLVYRTEVENGDFEVRWGTDESIKHNPTRALLAPPGERGDVVLAYATARMEDGSQQTEILTRDELDKIRAMASERGPWGDWWEQMARKTAIRRLCKYLPYSEDVERALGASVADDIEPEDAEPEIDAVEVHEAREADHVAEDKVKAASTVQV